MDVAILPSCRLCIKGSENLINIFDKNGLSKNIASILKQHFWFEVKDCDSFSHNICCNCWKSVQTFHSFYVQISNVHSEFYDNVRDKIIVEITENLPQDLKSEDDTIFNNLSDENCIYEAVPNLKVKESEDNSKVSDIESDYSSVESDTDDTNTDDRNRKTNKKVKKVKELEKIKEENIRLREFYKMECELCSTSFETFRNVSEHYRTAHKEKGYIRCCNKRISKRANLLDHMNRHFNPEAYKCEICSKIYASKQGVVDHMARHLSNQEKPFKCTKCPKAYTKRNLLTRHKSIHTEVKKLFNCAECGKGFARSDLLNVHKKLVHERAFAHVCEICAKVFKTKSNCEQHHRSMHSIVPQPKIQCQLCGIWLKDKNILRRHMISHEESKQTHICQHCSKKSPNRKALQNHIRKVHSSVIYECTLCDKSFKQAISLKEHMAAHTGEMLYICPHCPKTFNSSANMYSHKKKIHVDEWKEERKLKALGLG